MIPMTFGTPEVRVPILFQPSAARQARAADLQLWGRRQRPAFLVFVVDPGLLGRCGGGRSGRAGRARRYCPGRDRGDDRCRRDGRRNVLLVEDPGRPIRGGRGHDPHRSGRRRRAGRRRGSGPDDGGHGRCRRNGRRAGSEGRRRSRSGGSRSCRRGHEDLGRNSGGGDDARHRVLRGATGRGRQEHGHGQQSDGEESFQAARIISSDAGQSPYLGRSAAVDQYSALKRKGNVPCVWARCCGRKPSRTIFPFP